MHYTFISKRKTIVFFSWCLLVSLLNRGRGVSNGYCNAEYETHAFDRTAERVPATGNDNFAKQGR